VWKYLRSRPHALQCPEISTFATKVWFERADRIDGILPHSLHFSPKVGFKLFGRSPNQKAGLIPIRCPAQAIPFVFQIVIHEPGVIEGHSILKTIFQFRNRVGDITAAFRPCLSLDLPRNLL
jgi:hypothetical protein